MKELSVKQMTALQDRLIGALIGLANAINGNDHLIDGENSRLVIEALAAVQADAAVIEGLIERVQAEKYRIVPNCAVCMNRCGRTDDYDMQGLWKGSEESRALRSLILFGILDIAACIYPACADREVILFLYNALFVIGMEDWNAQALLPTLVELGKVRLRYRV